MKNESEERTMEMRSSKNEGKEEKGNGKEDCFGIVRGGNGEGKGEGAKKTWVGKEGEECTG